MAGGNKEKKRRNFGHLKGVETVKKIVKSSIKLKLKLLLFMFFHQKIGNDQKKRSLFYSN